MVLELLTRLFISFQIFTRFGKVLKIVTFTKNSKSSFSSLLSLFLVTFSVILILYLSFSL